jgi:NSS family neurotransmitter:Na+ symporter
MESGNEGLAFIHLTRLFTTMPGGIVIAGVFFMAMAFAAITSMISGFEITVRNFMDHGWSRNKSLKITSTVIFICGIPSALIVLEGGIPIYFKNQDHVWSFGLIVSGMFVCFAVFKYGIAHFRETLVNTEYNDLYIGKWWEYIMYLFPIQFMFLMAWYFSDAISIDPTNWWNPFVPDGFATIILQWGIALAILIYLNDWINKQPLAERESRDGEIIEVEPE